MPTDNLSANVNNHEGFTNRVRELFLLKISLVHFFSSKLSIISGFNSFWTYFINLFFAQVISSFILLKGVICKV